MEIMAEDPFPVAHLLPVIPEPVTPSLPIPLVTVVRDMVRAPTPEDSINPSIIHPITEAEEDTRATTEASHLRDIHPIRRGQNRATEVRLRFLRSPVPAS